MYDVIMIVIIMITILNYAGHIKVDTNLMMVLMAIALYVTAKQNQKNKQTKNKVEPLDGSTVAFDKEAFVNLNRIVNELVKEDQVTIAGNLIVKGALTVMNPAHDESDKANFRIMVADNGVARIGNQHAGEIHFDHDGWMRCYNWDKPGEYKKGIAAHELWTGGYLGSYSGAITFNENSGINIEHGDEYVRLKTGLGTEIHRTRTHHLIGVAWGGWDGTQRQHSTTGKICTKLNTNHELGFMIENNQWQMYVNGNGIGTYVHVHAKQNLTVDREFWCHGRSSFKMKDNVWSHINENGECKIRGNLKLDGHGGTGREIHAHHLYTYSVDVDTLRGHAWASQGFKNCIRMERHFTLRNDSGHYLVLGGGWSGNSINASHGVNHTTLEKYNDAIWWVGFQGIHNVLDSRWHVAWNEGGVYGR
jgi:hypothetical protein